jgi:hypothetical protein
MCRCLDLGSVTLLVRPASRCRHVVEAVVVEWDGVVASSQGAPAFSLSVGTR